jgi:dTDP-4-amino-4,6-dideoxy-D-glucose ammonia-lyase
LTSPRLEHVPEAVAIVGLGRWGRIVANMLTAFSPEIAQIHLVAEHNHAEILDWVERRRRDTTIAGSHNFHRVQVKPHIRHILDDDAVRAAFVTTMTARHADVTRQLLLRGKHTLVEKPMALSLDDAKRLVQLAEEKGLVLAVGHEYLMARYLHHFRAMIDLHLPGIDQVHIEWHDSLGGDKWGEPKRPDWSNNVVTDVLPHVLSQLVVLLGTQAVSECRLRATNGSLRAELELVYGSTPVIVRLDKDAPQPHRTTQVIAKDRQQMLLDFTREPGEIRLNGELLPPDPLADAFPRPLICETAYFFAQIQDADPELPILAKHSLGIVEVTEVVNGQLVREQAEILRTGLLERLPMPMPTSIRNVLRHALVAPLMAHGLLRNPKDDAALDHWAAHALRIVYHFARTPWTTQRDILQETALPKSDLLRLNAAIRDSNLLQDIMVNKGLGQKYWKTILPVISSGALQAALSRVYRFPFRIGLYPGVSCMFRCTFCGRNVDASYPRRTLDDGVELMKQIVAAAPAGSPDTFSISGGLEPMTNPRLGELIRHAKHHAFKPLLITNGYLLTPSHVDRFQGFWELDRLRISLYGVDDNSYEKVTGKRGAFEKVKRNTIEFLRLRNDTKPELRVGFNFIILPGCIEQTLRVLDVIEEINAAVPNGRGVDFLTLREDFGVPTPLGLSEDERARLTSLFQVFDERTRTPQLANLEVDFGYALFALREGVIGEPLVMVTHEGMRPSAYPQISVVADLWGDVFLYREAGFLDRPGNERYRVGRLTTQRSLESLLGEFVDSGQKIEPQPGDPRFMDAFDHVVTVTLNQAASDAEIGIPFSEGPIRARLHGGTA